MTRKNAATASAPKSRKKSKKAGKRTISIMEAIRLHFGNNPPKYGDKPPKPNLVLIPVKDLDIDSFYQRGVQSNVRTIAANFDYRMIGIPVVVLRGGKYQVIDAQQRTRAILLINAVFPGFLTSVWCEVVPDVRGKAEEAKVFRGRNDSKRLLPTEMFRAEWAAKDPEAISIVKDLHQNGLTVKGIPCPDSVSVNCIAAVKFAHKVGALSATIDVIRSTWGVIEEAFKVTCFHPIAAALHKNRGNVDFGHMVKTLKKFTPSGLEAAANTTAGHTRTVNIANRIVNAYNKGVKASDRLREVASGDIQTKEKTR